MGYLARWVDLGGHAQRRQGEQVQFNCMQIILACCMRCSASWPAESLCQRRARRSRISSINWETLAWLDAATKLGAAVSLDVDSLAGATAVGAAGEAAATAAGEAVADGAAAAATWLDAAELCRPAAPLRCCGAAYAAVQERTLRDSRWQCLKIK